MPLGTLAGPLGKKRAAHLLRRACFGASLAEIDAFAVLTAQEAFEQLSSTELPDPPLPRDFQTGTEWITTGATDANSEEFQLGRYLNAWMVGQALAAGVPTPQRPAYSFRERMVFFLHTLITTKQSVAGNSRAVYYQNTLFRRYALDREDWTIPNEDPELPDITVSANLKELTKKVSVDNAMLAFLDGRLNVKGSPNENYARELLELFSIGRGLETSVPEPEFDGDYYYFTETDVQEGARVLSGFNTDDTFSNIDRETGLPRGVIKGGIIASSHDNGTKQFSVRFGGSAITPDPELMLNGQPTEESLLDEVSQLVDLIYAQEQTPIHICRRIYRFFVYHEVSPALEADIIREMADIFIANDFKTTPVLEALFTSSHFYEGGAGYQDDNLGGLIKSPFDLTVGFFKNFEIPVPDYDTDLENYYVVTEGLLNAMSDQGLNLYEPYEVAGYPAYHQFPIYNRSWITTNYLTSRYDFVRVRITNGLDMDIEEIDAMAFVQANIPNATARDARQLIITLAEYFLPMHEGLSFEDGATSELTTQRLNYFMNAFLYNPQLDMDPEASWTFRWDNNEDPETVASQLVGLLNALLQTPEYQLM